MPLVQKTAAQSNTSTAVATLTGVTAGNALILIVSYSNAGGTAATSANVASSGDTWQTAVAPALNSNYGTGNAIFYVKNVGSGTHAVTFTNPSASSPIQTLELAEFSGVDTTAPFDVSASSTTGASNVTSANSGTTASTAIADELVVSGITCINFGGAISISNPATTGYSSLDIQDPYSPGFLTTQSSYKIVAATGTQVASWSWSGARAADAAIATFKLAATGQGARNTKLGQAVQRASIR
jgi:hypothetical protein